MLCTAKITFEKQESMAKAIEEYDGEFENQQKLFLYVTFQDELYEH